MRLSHFFIDRPIFAAVLAVVHHHHRRVAYSRCRSSQYPEIAPPTVEVTATYPGASAETVAETVADADRAADQRRREHALHVVASRPATAS